MAHRVRRLPVGLRLAHRGHRRHEHPVLDREPDVAARPDPQLLVDGRAPRLRAGRGRRPQERDAAIDAARSQLSGQRALGAFDELLAINQVANFAWWNEDHNYYIDLRASIPIRRARWPSAACGADTYDDALFLFYPEAMDVGPAARGGPTCSRWPPPATSTTTTTTRSARPPEGRRHAARKVEDPVLIEIFGMHHHYFEGLKSDADATVLTGFPASAGTVSGRARVHGLGTELFQLEEGEILVVRGHLAELDAGVRAHRRVRVRRRRFAHPRRHRQPRVRHPVRGRLLSGHLTHPDRRPDRGRRLQRRGDDPRPSGSVNQLAGKRIVVTGAGRGIGALLAAELRQRDAKVLTADLHGGDVVCDVSDPDAVAELFAVAGEVDGLVTCAALLVGRKRHDEIDLEEWDRMFAVNVRGTFLPRRRPPSPWAAGAAASSPSPRRRR